MPAAVRVFAAVQENGKTLFGQQPAIFLRPKARVMQLLAIEIADGCPFCRPAGEEKQALRRHMLSEHGEHCPLIVRRQMKEAVPGNDRVEPPVERDCAYVMLD